MLYYSGSKNQLEQNTLETVKETPFPKRKGII